MTMTAPWDAFFRSLPPAPHIDAKKIRGNVSDEAKQLSANTFAYFTTGSGLSTNVPFASEIGGRLRVVEANVRHDDRTGDAEAEIIVEIEVTESMCNVYGTMHGGCAAFMLDPSTVSSAILLGLVKGFDGSGVSQNMNVHWHHPAPLGTTLVITARSVFADGRARLSRCEMRDKSSGKLVVSGTHTFLNAGRAVKL
ncbi:HotDog domain-containing protein [Roridomyces roridus]|uniref:HotDog domain-containing protein n=1 Tax=Roridomyces roridus TaxID=1738132 RepID=A0AAD7FDT5_9AGAR|nr:HotDog domain-containing protein [Roridomyces roridus]